MTLTRSAVLSAGGLVCLLAGCVNPYVTRLPSFFAGDPKTERKVMERHDPFPSRELGPVLFTRPQGFVEQRPDTTQLNKEGMLRGYRRGVEPVPPPGVSTQRRYPNTVPQ